MEDVFNEQLVDKIQTKKDLFIRFGIILFSVVAMILSILFLKIMGVFLVFLIYVGLYNVNNMLNIEYEYIFTNGELDIDCIYNRSKRKRLCTLNLSEAELMANINDERYKQNFDRAEVTKDYSSGVIKDNTYCLLMNYQGKNTKFILEPNDSMLKVFSRYLTPKKLFIKKITN